LGEAYSRQKKFDNMIVTFDKIIEQSPDTYWAHYWKALACDRTKKVRAAIQSYSVFLEKAPQKHTKHREFVAGRVKYLKRLTTK
ncbi:MAG: hypothetical protein ACE5IR_06580, partial [bacterium]